jgi:hypothetical protein
MLLTLLRVSFNSTCTRVYHPETKLVTTKKGDSWPYASSKEEKKLSQRELLRNYSYFIVVKAVTMRTASSDSCRFNILRSPMSTIMTWCEPQKPGFHSQFLFTRAVFLEDIFSYRHTGSHPMTRIVINEYFVDNPRLRRQSASSSPNPYTYVHYP